MKQGSAEKHMKKEDQKGGSPRKKTFFLGSISAGRPWKACRKKKSERPNHQTKRQKVALTRQATRLRNPKSKKRRRLIRGTSSKGEASTIKKKGTGKKGSSWNQEKRTNQNGTTATPRRGAKTQKKSEKERWCRPKVGGLP